MKKGLILALVVGVMAVALPAGAVGPVFSELPSIIIGNTGDTATTTTARTVLRYLNALDLMDVVDWKNDAYTSATYRAYWSDAVDVSGYDVRVSGPTSWIDSLTTPELYLLMDDSAAGFGTPPPASANIVESGNFWVSLMNVSATATSTLTGAPYPPSAFIDSDGVEGWGLITFNESSANRGLGPPVAQSGLTDTATELLLVAAVTSGALQVMPSEPAELDVYSIVGRDDSTTSTWIYHDGNPLSDPSEAYGWLLTLPASGAAWIEPAARAPGDAVGFTASATADPEGLGKTYFGEYSLADGTGNYLYPMTAAGMADRLFTCRVRLRNEDAPTAVLCPGWRILYANVAYTHFGGLEVKTDEDHGAPARGSEFVAQAFWEVPLDTTETGDTGNLASYPFTAYGTTDWRDYSVIFGLMHANTGDYGVLTLEEITIEALDVPTTPVESRTYGDMSTWISSGYASVFPTLFADGSAAMTASNVTLTAGTDSSLTYRLITAFPPAATPLTPPALLASYMPAVDGQLVRMSYSARSVSVATTPIMRLFVHGYMSDFASGANNSRNYYWFDSYGAASDVTCKPSSYAIQDTIPGFENPGVPPATDVTLSTWAYTHTGGWQTGDYMLPDFSAFSTNAYATGSGTHGWQDDSGGVVLSNVAADAFDTW